MTKSTKQKLAYQKDYNAREEEKDKRVIYNRNRREAIRDGKVSKGDGMELAHEQMGAKGAVHVESGSKNAAWRAKNPKAYGAKK